MTVGRYARARSYAVGLAMWLHPHIMSYANFSSFPRLWTTPRAFYKAAETFSHVAEPFPRIADVSHASARYSRASPTFPALYMASGSTNTWWIASPRDVSESQ